MTGLGLYYRSLKHLKSKQVFYRVYYKIRSIKRRLTGFKYDYAGGNHGIKLSFQNFPLNKNSSLLGNTTLNDPCFIFDPILFIYFFVNINCQSLKLISSTLFFGCGSNFTFFRYKNKA